MKLEEVSLEHSGDIPPEKFAQSAALEYILDDIEGEHEEEIAGMLAEKGEATSEEIANELGAKLGSVRETLENLYESQAAGLRRSRDEETGWISFHWHLEPERALDRLKKSRRALLRETRKRLRRERENVFFTCENDCGKMGFVEAVEVEFECPGCGEKLREVDNGDIVSSLEKRAEKLEKALENSSKGEG